MTPTARSEKNDSLRNASRANTLERCTSMNGMATAASASRKATLVWVNAAGLMTMNCVPSVRACCTRSTSAASALLWKQSRFAPFLPANIIKRSLISSNVTCPYTSGSRLPSRFRLGPCNTRILFMHTVCRKLVQFVYLFCKDRLRTSKPGILQRFQELHRILIADHAEITHFIALRIEKQNAGRAVQAEAFEQCLVGLAVGGHVRLQQQHRLELGLHGRIGEKGTLHFLAGDAPVGVKIQHHRLPARLSDAPVEICGIQDAGELHGLRCWRFGAADVAERAQQVVRAGQRADQVSYAEQQGDHAAALEQSVPAAGVVRQSIQRAQVNPRKNQQRRPQQHLHADG